ncbi:unnamed protein product [Phytomonas sp. EM1]|nr:unnamed protein product [Phytomonas sp. EM1]|eukprot:CCW64493.1 unnamed protein product [Phytomonas sp. isolate EM1]
MISIEAFEESSPCNFEEEVALGYFADLRRDCSPSQYIDICHRLCSTEGVLYNGLRSIIWRDMVLGLDASPTVPHLVDSIISSSRLQSRDDNSNASHTSRARGSSCQSDVATERAAASVWDRKGRPVRPQRRCASTPAVFVALRGGRPISSRRRSTSQLLNPSRTVKDDPSSFYSVNDETVTSPFFSLPSNCQIRVVEADIKRSLWLFYPEEERRNRMRNILKRIILRVLANNPDRHYYQGLHELIGFIMYVLSPHLRAEELVSICEGMLLTRWRAFSEKKLMHSEALLYAMHAVIAEEDTSLAMALEKCGVGPESHYAVSWVITWYVHCVKNIEVLARLFDYFITDEDGMAVIFFTAAFVLSQRKFILNWIDEARSELLSSGFDEADDITVMAKIYSQMAKMPSAALDSMNPDELNKLIQEAARMRANYLSIVHREQANFINGRVCKLGFLANQRTRNAALRLLWFLLPREWRHPVVNRNLMQMVLLAGAVAFMTVAIVCKYKAH